LDAALAKNLRLNKKIGPKSHKKPPKAVGTTLTPAWPRIGVLIFQTILEHRLPKSDYLATP